MVPIYTAVILDPVIFSSPLNCTLNKSNALPSTYYL
jgi:hypothetical protein